MSTESSAKTIGGTELGIALYRKNTYIKMQMHAEQEIIMRDS
jgi:hypothetical protein